MSGMTTSGTGAEGDGRNRVGQNAGDQAVQAGGNITGPVATAENATATYNDNSVHHHYPVPPHEGDSSRARLLEKYLTKLGEVLSRKPPGVAGPLAVEWQAGDDARMSDPSEIIAECLARRRIILRGPAGAGKSVLLRRAALQSIRSGAAIPVILDLSHWKPAHSQAMSEISESAEARSQQFAVMARTSVVPINPSTFEEFLELGEVVLFVDGLNEVASQATSVIILNAIDAYLQQHPLSLSALVADRVHHDGGTDLWPWTELQLHPLTVDTVEAVLSEHFSADVRAAVSDADRALLGRPFFLEQAISTGRPALGSAESSLELFYTDQERLTEGDLDGLSAMAFEMYRNSTRAATLSFAEKWLTEATAHRLVADGTLVTSTDGEIQFEHQIKNDFLAARFLARHEEEWNSDSFNRVTFSANSTELLLSALRMLKSPSVGDRFLQAVYNWHWLYAVKTVGVSTDGVGTLFSKEVEAWLACCAAEKVLDPLIWTSEATRTMLEGLPNATFHGAAVVRSADDIIRLSHSIDSDEDWFVQWRRTLGLSADHAGREENLQLLAGDNPVMGWAVSNAAKRWSLNEADLRQLRAIYRSTSNTDIRWRVVHSLGAFRSSANTTLLFEALDKERGEWVRYGAIRSLVELAIEGTPDERRLVLEGLRDRLGALTNRLQLKLGEAVFVSHPPEGWATAVGPLLYEAATRQQHVVDIDRWRVLIRQFENYERGIQITPPGR
ncbi:NACHT domain-containing protein [Streptomyces sp. LN245]|uniref:NACHT domain-containing protein n=1 Tax=Streptomyces sp. LN245 TaxID=3112975 RepID=UPI00371BD6C1